MVKSVLGVNHQGLREWISQRLSAILMAVYSVGMIAYVASHPDLTFAEWQNLFSQPWMKIATLLFIFSLLVHAWVGVWTIFTDYVKSFVLRCLLHSLVLLTLAVCFIWAIMILWSV